MRSPLACSFLLTAIESTADNSENCGAGHSAAMDLPLALQKTERMNYWRYFLIWSMTSRFQMRAAT
jgi:hypothetical protein